MKSLKIKSLLNCEVKEDKVVLFPKSKYIPEILNIYENIKERVKYILDNTNGVVGGMLLISVKYL